MSDIYSDCCNAIFTHDTVYAHRDYPLPTMSEGDNKLLCYRHYAERDIDYCYANGDHVNADKDNGDCYTNSDYFYADWDNVYCYNNDNANGDDVFCYWDSNDG